MNTGRRVYFGKKYQETHPREQESMASADQVVSGDMMRRRTSASAFLVYLLVAGFSSHSIGRQTITPTQPLADGDGATLISAGGRFELGFFSPVGSPNNRYIGVWYHNISVQTVVWVANRRSPIADRSGRLSVTTDGTLFITDANSSVLWSARGSVATAYPVAELLDNGNFVVREADGDGLSSYAWQSFDFPSDTLLPEMKLGWDLRSGRNRNLTAWANEGDPAPGANAAVIDVRGNPQLCLFSGTQLYSRVGPWNGLHFSGCPYMLGYTFPYSQLFDVHFTVDSEEISYSFSMHNSSVLSQLTIDHSGEARRLVWIEDRKSWNVMWYIPKDQCDKVSLCGPYGACYPSLSRMCHCLQGFRPKNPQNWNLSDGTDGCVRRTALDCHGGTDGFQVLGNAKVPDTSSAMVDRRMNLLQCRLLCLANCSCRAYASANISGDGSGCIIWTTDLTDIKIHERGGQDLYVRLAAADIVTYANNSLPGTGNAHQSHAVVIIVVSVSAVPLFVCVALCIWRKKKTGRSSDEAAEPKDFDLPVYDFATIMDATNNFSIDNKLGEGGFGPVHKGKLLKEDQEIAVKRLSTTSSQGVEEFKNELLLIAKLQHRNLVRLLGCCIQGGERMLIYEYMPNGSLDTFLFDKEKGMLLDWKTRCHIIVGIARGLLYLHYDSRLRIIHRDLKASNILLDKNMNPKISDFGLAKIVGGDETAGNTKKVVGTHGYMSPEYVMDGVFSVKSDVFSFGVLVLEIISGRKNRGDYHSTQYLNLLGLMWSLWKEDKVLELIDSSIAHSFSMNEILRYVKIGFLCVQAMPENRPTISSVLAMLDSNNIDLLPEPMQPGFVIMSDSCKAHSLRSCEYKNSLSINQVSITELEYR